MKKFLLIVPIFYISILQAQVVVEWYNYPGGVSIAVDESNNNYTANWDYNPAGDITLTKRNDAGEILWETKFDNTDNTRHEVATWLDTDSEGNILVSGTIRSGFSSPVNAASVLMKFDSTGNLLWRNIYENTFDGSSTRRLLIDSENSIYVLGIGSGPAGQVTKVKKFNSSGNSVWDYYDSGIGGPILFKFTPDSNIVIVHRGITGSINGFSKIDLNGQNIWSLGGVNSLSVGDAAGDAFGNTYIINGKYEISNNESILTKLNPNGTVVWTQTTPILGSKVEVGSDNFPIVGGTAIIGYGAAIAKYDDAGNQLWVNLDADGISVNLLGISQLKLDEFNDAYLSGSTLFEMGLCKVNNAGSNLWLATTPSGFPAWFDFGLDHHVYMTGGTTAKFAQTITVNLNNSSFENAFATKVYPNPFNQLLTLEIDVNASASYNISIVDAIGRVVKSFPKTTVDKGNNILNFEVSTLEKGIYFISIAEENKIKTIPIIKN